MLAQRDLFYLRDQKHYEKDFDDVRDGNDSQRPKSKNEDDDEVLEEERKAKSKRDNEKKSKKDNEEKEAEKDPDQEKLDSMEFCDFSMDFFRALIFLMVSVSLIYNKGFDGGVVVLLVTSLATLVDCMIGKFPVFAESRCLRTFLKILLLLITLPCIALE